MYCQYIRQDNGTRDGGSVELKSAINWPQRATDKNRSESRSYVILAKPMLKPRHTNLLLIGLVLLLGVQLTGITCLGEWQVAIHSAQSEISGGSPATEENLVDHGCPCHFIFQSVSLAVPEILSPHTDDISSSPTLYVPTFVVSLFHPPLNI